MPISTSNGSKPIAKVVKEVDNPVFEGDEVDLGNDHHGNHYDGRPHTNGGTSNGSANSRPANGYHEDYEQDHMNEIKFGRKKILPCSWTRLALVVIIAVIIIALIIGIYFGATYRASTDTKSNESPSVANSQGSKSSEVKGSFKIVNGASYSVLLEKESSPEFIDLASSIQISLDEKFKESDLKDSYSHNRVTKFSEGSVVVESYVVFKKSYAGKELENKVEMVLKGTQTDGKASVGPFTIEAKSVNFHAISKVLPNYSSPVLTTQTVNVVVTQQATTSKKPTKQSTVEVTTEVITTQGLTTEAVVVTQPDTSMPTTSPRTEPGVSDSTTSSVTSTESSSQSPTVVPTASSAPRLEIRLAGGSVAWEGRVEILHGERWKTICANGNWDNLDAEVVCRQLNFSGPAVGHSFGDGIGVFYTETIECTGREPYLSACPHSYSNCEHIRDAGVICTAPTPGPTLAPVCDGVKCFGEDVCVPRHQVCDGIHHCQSGNDEDQANCPSLDTKVRLIGPAAGAGILEVFFNETWGLVCDDMFDRQDAQVVCRMLNYSVEAALHKTVPYELPKSTPIWLSGLGCNGNELSLAQCSHNGWGQHYCRHTEAVYVTCIPATSTDISTSPSSVVVNSTLAADSTTIAGQATLIGNETTIHPADTTTPGLTVAACSGAMCNDGTCIEERLLCNGLQDCISENVDEVNCTSPEFRLVGGKVANEGRVEVLHNGTWGSICDDSFGVNEAKALCSILGYNSSTAMFLGTTFGGSSGPIWISGLQCQLSAARFTNCHHYGWGGHNCQHNEDVSIACPTTDQSVPVTTTEAVRECPGYRCQSGECILSELLCNGNFDCLSQDDENNCSMARDVRLMNGSSVATGGEGRFEVLHNNTWGTVCRNGLSDTEAAVFCNQLGFNGNNSRLVPNMYGKSNGPIWLASVYCTGTEQSLDQCNHPGWGSVNLCTHADDVAVKCSKSTVAPTATTNTTESNATVITPSSCSGVVCGDGSCVLLHKVCDGYNDCFDHSDEANCPAQNVSVRLANGLHADMGRVEVLYNGTWGTICDDAFTTSAAKVICKQLGYNDTSQAERVIGIRLPGNGPIWLSNVHCSGVEVQLSECTHNGWGVHNCVHQEDVLVSCREQVFPSTTAPDSNATVASNDSALGPTTVPNLPCQGILCASGDCLPLDATCPVPTVQVRLANGTEREGRLEVFHNNQWGTVCRTIFSSTEASVVCRMLGFNTSGERVYTDLPGSGPILLSHVHCQGPETSIAECEHHGWGVHSCQHTEDVVMSCVLPTTSVPGVQRTTTACSGLICTGDDSCIAQEKVCDGIQDCVTGDDEQNCPTPNVTVRLVNGSHIGEGLVEMLHKGIWGTICNEGFNDIEAKVVCTMLGFGGPASVITHRWQGSGKIWLTGVFCTGSEVSIAKCDHRGWGVHTCSHYDDVGVSCTVPPSTAPTTVTPGDFITNNSTENITNTSPQNNVTVDTNTTDNTTIGVIADNTTTITENATNAATDNMTTISTDNMTTIATDNMTTIATDNMTTIATDNTTISTDTMTTISTDNMTSIATDNTTSVANNMTSIVVGNMVTDNTTNGFNTTEQMPSNTTIDMASTNSTMGRTDVVFNNMTDTTSTNSTYLVPGGGGGIDVSNSTDTKINSTLIV